MHDPQAPSTFKITADARRAAVLAAQGMTYRSGDLQRIARDVGITRERVRQIAVKAGVIRVLRTARRLCTDCGASTKFLDGLCVRCREIMVITCAWCGMAMRRSRTTEALRARQGYKKWGVSFCCPSHRGLWIQKNLRRFRGKSTVPEDEEQTTCVVNHG